MSEFAPEVVAEMRGWIADCTWGDLEPDEIPDLTDAEVVAGVRRFYSGGVRQFLADIDVEVAA